ncbi:DUF58 domain-containing protein [Candidatus Woesearchaeota archaeon]|jgi:uncharacterized protein (DUF58 family)|nr:DUF58 domain-containing protein [Candidatus Woesearchaeota archaeon]MBT3538157.1 DUF58 domain-containing protein [Candidatus Woesearchaeota archaeon]MBT4697484.1 DUF58 domain-containing protein [Candidatus Woesearchaeota archaeon]MBT4716872.1 DUF58 domain-containing protein [Candidatus Woesearchaeota archaeon]MBT7105826.1 DUF58 domain-containing protein [Candidatus Woesearchaeota archaeon]
MEIDLEFLNHLKRLSVILNKNVTTSFIGERQSPAIGRGLIFKDHAPYTPGDDFRTIDWRVYARTDKLFVKRYEEERNLTIHILLDLSASMDYGKSVKKSNYAAMVAIGFAFMALSKNERFVLSTFSDRLDLFKPKKGRKQLMDMVSFLNSRKPSGKTDIAKALVEYRKKVTSKSLIVVISDFLYDAEELTHGLYAYKDHTIKLVQVLDKEELDLNLEGDFRLQDLETNTIMKTFISPFLKKKYGQEMQNHIANIQRVADSVRAKFHTANTSTPVFETFYNILG